MKRQLDQLVDSGWLRPLDLHTALFLERLAGGEKPSLLLAAALVSKAVDEGHVCLPLDAAKGFAGPGGIAGLPDPQQWRQELMNSSVVGAPGEQAPLILDHRNRLYFSRFHRYEEDIAQALVLRARPIERIDPHQARHLLDRLFPLRQGTDWQQVAAALSLLKRLVIISGGPGTGKTYTVARILALLQAMHNGGLRIGLAAPTGKAAARMRESIVRAKGEIPADLGGDIPEEAATLHRLLGYRPLEGGFVHHQEHRLSLDLLVVDEASMIDVALMAALVRALPEQSRLILLGDRHQLASVEGGRLFADICGQAENRWSEPLQVHLARLCGTDTGKTGRGSEIDDCVVQLRHSHRFSRDSAIGRVAAWIGSSRSGSGLETDILAGQDIRLLPSIEDPRVQEEIVDGFGPVFQAEDPAEALTGLGRFRILCALRQGPAGVQSLNRLVEEVLARVGMLPSGEQWYQGRPILITRNQYSLKLYNGDNGIVWPDSNGRLVVWFETSEGRLRSFSPARLPSHETSYAITVHKSQGSEFEQVMFILPEEEVPLLSRELVYTAITRARKRLVLCGRQQVLANAVRREIRRFSGLADHLRPSGPPGRLSLDQDSG